MRYPAKEKYPFSHPCWTADEIANYTGPVFRATVSWFSSVSDRLISSDLECPSMLVLHNHVDTLRDRNRHQQPSVSYGPHTVGDPLPH